MENINCDNSNIRTFGYISITIVTLSIIIIINSLVLYVEKKSKKDKDTTTSSVDKNVKDINYSIDKFLYYFYIVHILFVVFELIFNIVDHFKIYEASESTHSKVISINIILAIIYLVYVFRFYIIKGKLI